MYPGPPASTFYHLVIRLHIYIKLRNIHTGHATYVYDKWYTTSNVWLVTVEYVLSVEWWNQFKIFDRKWNTTIDQCSEFINSSFFFIFSERFVIVTPLKRVSWKYLKYNTWVPSICDSNLRSVQKYTLHLSLFFFCTIKVHWQRVKSHRHGMELIYFTKH